MGQHGCDTLVEMQGKGARPLHRANCNACVPTGEDRVDSITATVCVEQLDVGDGKVEFVQLVCRGDDD